MSYSELIHPEPKMVDSTECRNVVYTGSFEWFMILVGGHPKGHNIPFSADTKSGKILRNILYDIRRDPVIIDLWENAEQEKEAKVRDDHRRMMGNCVEYGGRVVCLGVHVFKAVKKSFTGSSYQDRLELAPHPASRHKGDVAKLKAILASYPEHWCVQGFETEAYAYGWKRLS